MLGKREVWYFGAALMFAAGGFVLALTKPDSLVGYAAVLTPVCGGLYGGGLGKLWIKQNGISRNGVGSTKTAP